MYDEIQAAVTAAFAPKPDAAAEQAAAVSEAARTLAAAKTKAEQVTFKAALVEHGVIYGVAASTALDHEGEITKAEAVVQMAYDFCSSSERVFKSNHDEILKADLVASIPGKPIYADDGVTIKAIDITAGSEDSWIVGVRPHDAAIYEAAKAGEIRGFSYGGFSQKVSD